MRADRAVHPVWCILLTWFTQHCECRRSCNSTPTHREVKILSDEVVRTALSLHQTVTSAAKALSTSPQRLTIFCRCAGIPVDARPSKLDDTTLATIRRHIIAGMPPTEIAHATHLSTTSIYRVLASIPDIESPYRRRLGRATDEAKRLWLTHLKEHPEATKTELRHSAPATFAMLRRNAPEWLRRETQVPAPRLSRTCVRRSAVATFALTRAVDVAEAHLDSLDGPPRRRSAYRLRELLGINEYALVSSVARSALRVSFQTRDEHIRARVGWVMHNAPTLRLDHWRTARAAMLRLKTLRNWKLRCRDAAQARIDEQSNFISRNRHQG
ncbi:TnsD family Tn7-like transposition protein [Paraburkholderia strydomiana]|uniref:TnsD family Tn7-like transposition protein n=1 Tax=Paraburkholderia strydomiana TaxID=1245417 RepID=UPI0035B54530